MNPEQLTSTPTKQDLLNEEIQKLVMKTRLEIQQREDIRRHFAERMKFVPHLRARDHFVSLARRSEQDPTNTELWKMVEGGNHCCPGFNGSCQYWCDHTSGKKTMLRRLMESVNLEDLPDSRERARALVLWLSCEGQIDVSEDAL